MTLEEAVARVPEFNAWNHAERIRFFMWFLQSEKKHESIQPADVARCFSELSLHGPARISPFIRAMVERSPKEALKSGRGYRLERRIKETFDGKYGVRPSTQALTQELQALEQKITDPDQRAYLDEVLVCFKNRAYRAAIIMAWNLAYDHFLRHVFYDTKRIADFNNQLLVTFQKKPPIAAINKFEDFGFMKEDQVLMVAKSATILSNGRHKVLKEKLDRRNAVAHPGGLVVNDVTAEEFIRDLVDNIVLKL